MVQVPRGLQVHPELWCRLQELREAERRVGRDAALAANHLVEAIQRDAHLIGSLYLRQLHWLEKFLEEHLAGMRWFTMLWNHRCLAAGLTALSPYVHRRTGSCG